jgi:enolase
VSEIRQVTGREVLDSRGNPTVEAEVVLDDGARGRAAVPSGASTGAHEALELRDGEAGRYGGKGVLRAVDHVEDEIGGALAGMKATDQRAVDRRLVGLDGTPNRGRLGANALLAVSMATARAAADHRGEPLHRTLADLPGGRVYPDAGALLPVPLLNVLNGGAHADNDVDMQEFMVVPHGYPTFAEALRAGAECFHALRRQLVASGHCTAVGDEGGVAPDLGDSREALELLVDAVEAAGHQPGVEVALALDAAATELWDPDRGTYRLPGEGATLSADELIGRYDGWVEAFPVVSIEDGLAEDDWQGWRRLTRRLGSKVQLVGDDLFVTQTDRIERGVEEGAANALLVKPNQVGTVTETLEAMAAARDAGWASVVSHRSGETEDTFIADLAVATGAGQLKAGSACRSERVAKYNRLLRVEEALGDEARFAGGDGWPRG